jgi:hypothetical protein
MRPILRALACAWVCCQMAGVAAGPLAVYFGPAEVVASSEDACCPGVAPGQVCPMHHTREGKKQCVMRSACASSTAALLTLVGGVGVLPSPVSAPADLSGVTGRAPRLARSAIARSELPDPPPPRA